MPSKRSLNMIIWLRWQRPMKGPAKSTKYTSKLTQWHPPVTIPILWFKQVLSQNHFRKALSRKPVANADAHITTGNAQLTELHAASVAIKITGLSNVEALGGGTVQLVAHPPWEGHRTDNGDSATSKPSEAEQEEEETRGPLPRNLAKVKDMAEEARP